MSIVSALEQIEQKVENALEEYSDELKDRQESEAPEMFGGIKGSLRKKDMGRWHKKVGIDEGILMAIQLNQPKQHYEQFYLGGHSRTSPPIHFSNGAVIRFQPFGGNPFISDTFKSMPSFKSFY